MKDKRCKDCNFFSNIFYDNKDYGKCCKKERTVYRLAFSCSDFVEIKRTLLPEGCKIICEPKKEQPDEPLTQEKVIECIEKFLEKQKEE